MIQDGVLVQSIIFVLKDLRNAIAHNNVIFDTRFKERCINKNLVKLIENDVKIQNVNFNNITDYIILVSYILKKLNKNNKEIIININNYLKYINILERNIPRQVYDQIILTSDRKKIKKFLTFLNLKKN